MFKEAEIDNLRILKVTYRGPTNARGSRVRIRDTWRNESASIHLDNEYKDAMEAAINFCTDRGFIPSYVGSMNGGAFTNVLMFHSFTGTIVKALPIEKGN